MKRTNLTDLRKSKNAGISLLELIIVVSIMAVLIGILTPNLMKYVNKSKRSRDLVTAERIATACSVAFATNPEAYDEWEKWNGLKETVKATVNGVTETYEVYLVVSNESNPYNCFHGTVAAFGKKDGSTGFYGTVNSEIGASTTRHNSSLVPKYKVKKSGKIPGRDKYFGNVDTWRICKRVDNGQLEVWTADHNKYGGYPCFRVWPVADDEYTK